MLYRYGNVYRNKVRSVTYNAQTGDGYSYETKIAKRINGIVYLDTHYFSTTTSKHRGQIKSVLAALRETYIEVDAGGKIDSYVPTGVQEGLF